MAFQRAGWIPVGQVGNHLVMTKPGVRVNLSIPQHTEFPGHTEVTIAMLYTRVLNRGGKGVRIVV